MGNLLITMDEKRPDKFLIETPLDVSMLGLTTKTKWHSYYMNISPWNMVDLHVNAARLGLTIDTDPRVEPIVEILRQELKKIKLAARFKTMPVDEINDIWEEEEFPFLFPKLQADPFQKRMVLWLLEVGKGGCFAEPGLGKTIIGIFLLGKLLYDKKIEKPLIFAPLSLLNDTVWFKDLAQFSDFKPINLRDPEQFWNPQGDIYFCNPDKLAHWCYTKTSKANKSYNEDNFFAMMKPDAIYFDESSCLKTHDSYTTRAFIKIAKATKYLGLASGIPAPNSIFQIWGQMRALNSVLGDNYSAFEQRYGILRSVGPIQRYFPRANAEMEIRKRIDHVSYFVKRDDVMQLPTRFVDGDHNIYVDLHPEHKKLYDKIENDYIAAVSGYDSDGNLLKGDACVEYEVTMRMKLLQILNGFVSIEEQDSGDKTMVSLPWNAKLDALDQKVKEIISVPGDNAIVWCRFRWEIETIYEKYKDVATFVYGGMTDNARMTNLHKWLNEEGCRLIVCMPGSVKFGHTWLKANHTIFFSGTEDYDQYAQARERNYRRGQKREVHEWKIITKNTVERKVWLALASRQKLDKFLKDYYSVPSR